MIRVGSTVGNYTVISKLGEGAMATVYLAEHPRIGKRVAIKVIHPELSTSQEMVSRFFTEARAASQIHHENVVDIQDFGQTPDGDNFIIMEYLEGDSLQNRLKTEGRFEVARAVQIAQLLCEGLAAAHTGGVIHRDLKPDNIFLVRRGQNPDFPKILDFGLAKITGTPAQAGANHKTRTGSVLGTPHYMAPEQCEGKTTVDGRADIYSLGCILFQMVTGDLPFPGEGFGEVLVKHLREPPPSPRSHNPQIPPALDKIILHCLAKKREWRFQTILDLGRALRDPERFSREIGDDPRRIMGPMPGEPDPGPLPAGSPGAGVPAAAQMETLIGGAGAPALPQAVAPVPTAAPEQRTIIAMASPLPVPGAPPPAPPGAPPSPLSNLETLVGGGASPGLPPGSIPLPGGARSGRTVVAEYAPGTPGFGGPSPHDFPTVMPGMPGSALPHPLPPPPKRPLHRSPAFLGLLGGVGLALVGLVIGPLLRPRVYTITVNSSPAGAQVLRDGKPAGQTPLVLQLKKGEPDVKLVLHKDGFVDSVRQVQANSDQVLTVRLLPKPTEEGTDAGQGAKEAGDEEAAPKAPERPEGPQHAGAAQPERPEASKPEKVERPEQPARPEAPRPERPKRPRKPKATFVPF